MLLLRPTHRTWARVLRADHSSHLATGQRDPRRPCKALSERRRVGRTRVAIGKTPRRPTRTGPISADELSSAVPVTRQITNSKEARSATEISRAVRGQVHLHCWRSSCSRTSLWRFTIVNTNAVERPDQRSLPYALGYVRMSISEVSVLCIGHRSAISKSLARCCSVSDPTSSRLTSIRSTMPSRVSHSAQSTA